MKRAIIALTSLSLLMIVGNSCVSSKIHKNLQGKFEQAADQNQLLEEENQMLKADLADSKANLENSKRRLSALEDENLDNSKKIAALEKDYKSIKDSYEQLANSSNELLSQNAKNNLELLKSLENSKNLLEAENKKLRDKEKKISELEFLIKQREEYLSSIKDNLSKALRGFEGKGLSVVQKNGKVYVSLENRLLFPSGSWVVNQDGTSAIRELSKVLANQSDLNVVIEGHTDADAFKGGKDIEDNWDLSVKRSTAIVKLILSNKGISPQRITAAGKGEFVPVESNKTAEGKSKNRRIEVIIEPDLSQIESMLNGI